MSTADETKPPFGPNEERYNKCAQPHADANAANSAIEAFFAELGALREKHGVPEVLVVAAAYHGTEEERKAACTSIMFGRYELAPDLAAAAHGFYVRPILDRAEELSGTKKRRKK